MTIRRLLTSAGVFSVQDHMFDARMGVAARGCIAAVKLQARIGKTSFTRHERSIRLGCRPGLCASPERSRSQSRAGLMDPMTSEPVPGDTAAPLTSSLRLSEEQAGSAVRLNLQIMSLARVACAPRLSSGWWSWTGSNRRPEACKATALPTELQPRTDAGGAEAMSRRLVGLGRVELPTSRLSGVRSNHLSYRPEADARISANGSRHPSGVPCRKRNEDGARRIGRPDRSRSALF